VDLNKKQQIRNQRSALRNAMGTVGGTVEDPRNRKEKAQAEALYDVAKTATASVGKFDVVSKSQKANAPREKSKGAQKFAPVVGNKKAGVAEQQNNLKILGRMLGQEGSGDKVLNQTKAAKSVHDEVGAKDAASRREAKVVKKISKKMERKKMKKKK
jgi:hypothetical protein